jgi:hypothetical protein
MLAILPSVPILPMGATPNRRSREIYIQNVALIHMAAEKYGWDYVEVYKRLYENREWMRASLKRRGLPGEWIREWDAQARGLLFWKTPRQVYDQMWAQAYEREKAAA